MAKKRTSDDENEYVHPEPDPTDPVPTPHEGPIGPFQDLGDGKGIFLLMDVNWQNVQHRQLEIAATTGHKIILEEGEYLHVDEDDAGQWRYAASR